MNFLRRSPSRHVHKCGINTIVGTIWGQLGYLNSQMTPSASLNSLSKTSLDLEELENFKVSITEQFYTIYCFMSPFQVTSPGSEGMGLGLTDTFIEH